MKFVKTLGIIALVSVIIGLVWNYCVWRFHFPYFEEINWLWKLIPSDGEGSYNILLLGMIFNIFIALTFIWFIGRYIWSKMPKSYKLN